MAAVVLVSTNAARNKAADAAAQSYMKSEISSAIIYADDNGSLTDFKLNENFKSLNLCDKQSPELNIFKDGKQLAIIVKSCAKKGQYFCIDIDINKSNSISSVVEKALNFSSQRKTSCQ